jgi:large subunit ribosomal protein L6
VSRIGKKIVIIPNGVTVTLKDGIFKAKGPKGELEMKVHPAMTVNIVNEELTVVRPDDTKQNKALHGLTRALIQNIIDGITVGYSKTLDFVGVGYRTEMKGQNILINIGFSHPIYFLPPEGITFATPVPTQIVISGTDKQLVGLVAAKIRSIRPPEPYKGKGIKYSDEQIIRKAGKTAGK